MTCLAFEAEAHGLTLSVDRSLIVGCEKPSATLPQPIALDRKAAIREAMDACADVLEGVPVDRQLSLAVAA